MNFLSGEIAALATSICWSFTSIFFTIAGKEVGSTIVNRTRLLLACFYLAVFHFFLYGNPLPLQAEPYQWSWLGLSGIIGLVIGDAMLFQAFVIIGARLSMLLMSLVPIISTLLAWIILQEILTPLEIFAIVLTIAGIAWVVSEKKNPNGEHRADNYLGGILLGIGGAIGQALALITAKKGFTPDFPALSATLIRIIVATVVIWIYAIFRKTAISNFKFLKNKKAYLAIFGGSIVGPFLGIWLSLAAIKYTHIGIASTLMALPPIFLIPLSHWIFKERITLRSIAGTVVATVGVAFIFLF